MTRVGACPTNHRRVTIGTVIRLVEGEIAHRPERAVVEVGICRDCGYAVERKSALRSSGAWRMVAGAPTTTEDR